MVTQRLIDEYRENGFVRVPGLISRSEALNYREAALRCAEKLKALSDGPIFAQFVNVWQQDPEMRSLTLHPAVSEAAKNLNGTDLRLWHDQVLIKPPGVSKPTEFHQDQPYWPHANSPNPISCWIALGDVPPERGCMTFIPRQHHRTELRMQNLTDDRSLFEIAPDMEWEPRVTIPMRAGDATFHHGRCPHMATQNLTAEPRVAHVVIMMPAETTYTGSSHVVTDPLGLQVGQVLDHAMFPLL